MGGAVSAIEKGFMQECVDGKNSMKSYCQCTWDYLNNVYSINELLAKFAVMDESEILKDQVFQSAVVSCLGVL